MIGQCRIRLIVFVVGAACLLTPSAGAADRQPILVLFSVDVETMSDGTADRDIWGRLPGVDGEYGIGRIMDIFDQYDRRCTFFVNVYEADPENGSPMKEACRAIHRRGHDLQLHTHPKPMFGIYGMYQGDTDRQAEILRSGTEMVEQWTGHRVVAHRAGAYLADRRTLEACRRVGIAADFSLVVGGNGSPLARELDTVNAPVVVDGVLEVPVTTIVQAGVGDLWQSTRFLDIESTSAAEIREAVSQLYAAGVPTAVIMIHSFSLVRFDEPNRRVIAVFETLLDDFTADPRVEVATAGELVDLWRADPGRLSGSDMVPNTGWWLTYRRSWSRLGEGWKNVVVALAPPGFVAFAGIAGAGWMRRRRRKRAAA